MQKKGNAQNTLCRLKQKQKKSNDRINQMNNHVKHSQLIYMGTDLQLKQSVKKFREILENPITQKIDID